VEIKCQLDATEAFIADLIACSTCFGASLCPSSAAQKYYTMVAACGISCCGFQVAGLVRSWGLCVRFAGCCRPALLPVKTAQFTQFFRQVLRHTVKSLSLTCHLHLDLPSSLFPSVIPIKTLYVFISYEYVPSTS